MPATDEPISRDEQEPLVAALRRGDDAAYEQLVRVHIGRLLAVARRFLRREEDARDAVQEAFLSAFKAMDRFDGRSQLGTWLHRITVNVCLMKLRSLKRRPEVAYEDLLPRFRDDGHREEPCGAWNQTPADVIESAELRARVRSAIDELPESLRLVILMRDIEEIDTEQTANRLEITPNAVKVRLHRARQALREILAKRLAASEGPATGREERR
ncbi:MAG: sigma-70 family RNA polymerase sigma factor [Phycisphaerales bacterium]